MYSCMQIASSSSRTNRSSSRSLSGLSQDHMKRSLYSTSDGQVCTFHVARTFQTQTASSVSPKQAPAPGEAAAAAPSTPPLLWHTSRPLLLLLGPLKGQATATNLLMAQEQHSQARNRTSCSLQTLACMCLAAPAQHQEQAASSL